MGVYLATNLAKSTLNTSLGGTVGDVTLQIRTADVALFPVVNNGGSGSDYTYLVLTNIAKNFEVVKVTRRDSGSSTMTVVRGQSGTTIRAWSTGDSVSLRMVAQVVNDAFSGVAGAAASAAAAAVSETNADASATAAEVAKITWLGAWSGATAYVLRDAVQSGGNSYICNTAHTNQVPPNASYWDLMASKGTDGAGGDAFTNTATSIDGENAVFSSTGGKTLKRDTLTATLVKAAAGIYSAASAADITSTLGATAVQNATTAAACSGNSATATSATTATNLAGGALGAMPYQSGAGATAMLAAGTSGYILKANGAGAPSWVAQSTLSVGSATTATTATTANALATGNNYTVNALTLSSGALTMGGAGSTCSAPMTTGSVLRGYLYGDSNGVGFLNNTGGWAARLDYGTSNWYVYGNVTAYSDERVKTNWRGIGDGFIENLAALKSGIYDRTDCELTQVGVGAQSLQKFMPDAVTHNKDTDELSVAYGNAALVACVELAKELVALRAEVERLKR